MSDKASIIVRYEIEDEQMNTTYKGLICNHYRGFDPVGLVSRSAEGISYLLENVKYLNALGGGIGESNLAYQTIRRMFDVNFGEGTLHVSVDAVSNAKRAFNENRINKDDLLDAVLWCDTDYGQLLIDIVGKKGQEEIRYAFVDNIYKLTAYTIEEYMSKFSISTADIGSVAKAFYFECKTPVCMNESEIKSFVTMDIYEYIFHNEALIEEQKDVHGGLDISELELSVRSYNCLKRAGVNTIEELKKMDIEKLRSIRNINEKCVTEKLEKLNAMS